MHFSNHIEIKVAPDRLFHFLRKLENMPLWNYFVLKVTRLPSEESRERYHQKRKNDEQVLTIIQSTVPSQLIIATETGSNFSFERKMTIEARGENVSFLKDDFQLSLPGGRLMEWAFKAKMRRAVGENLIKLKQLLENGHTVLQDGRKVEL